MQKDAPHSSTVIIMEFILNRKKFFQTYLIILIIGISLFGCTSKSNLNDNLQHSPASSLKLPFKQKEYKVKKTPVFEPGDAYLEFRGEILYIRKPSGRWCTHIEYGKPCIKNDLEMMKISDAEGMQIYRQIREDHWIPIY
jgi:hypothetical protein